MFSWANVRVSALDPVLVDGVTNALDPLPVYVEARDGFRTWAYQAMLYARFLAGGPRAAPPGQSAHNYGEAIDVAVFTRSAQGFTVTWDTNSPEWQQVLAAIAAVPELADGIGYGDPGHIERAGWQAIARANGSLGTPITGDDMATVPASPSTAAVMPIVLSAQAKNAIIYGVAFVLIVVALIRLSHKG